jgi:hypothetical protein
MKYVFNEVKGCFSNWLSSKLNVHEILFRPTAEQGTALVLYDLIRDIASITSERVNKAVTLFTAIQDARL